MYQPRKYARKDPNYQFKFIKDHPFATMVIKGSRLLATHIPILTQGGPEDFRLYGHIANHNEMYQHLEDGAEALLIFKGPDAYVSSSWYKDKDISTWDYSAVHVNVKLTLQTRQELEECLEELVRHFERQQERPLYYSEIPDQMLVEHLPLITGFWCKPVKMEGVAKLHQNYGKKDVRSVVEHLSKSDDPQARQVAEDVKKENLK